MSCAELWASRVIWALCMGSPEEQVRTFWSRDPMLRTTQSSHRPKMMAAGVAVWESFWDRSGSCRFAIALLWVWTAGGATCPNVPYHECDAQPAYEGEVLDQKLVNPCRSLYHL